MKGGRPRIKAEVWDEVWREILEEISAVGLLGGSEYHEGEINSCTFGP